MRLTILFDNVPGREELTPLWGFSCHVSDGSWNWLFDTGSNGRVLLKNARKLGIELSQVSALVLSHPHWDHVGGVDTVIEEAPLVRIYAPASLSRHWVSDLEWMSGGVTTVGEEPMRLFDDVYSTGMMGEVGEQAVVFYSPAGPVVLTGCAHPGIVSIVARAVEMTGEPPALVVGGFHLMESDRSTIDETIRGLISLGVRRVCPTHCTGEYATEMIRKAFGNDFLDGGLGKSILLG
jgi:7,8-dihydropterin-6-yl-methyl-4-(beta-D-ribofuranosyl)aminobenzene 5'-phosphate synthase